MKDADIEEYMSVKVIEALRYSFSTEADLYEKMSVEEMGT